MNVLKEGVLPREKPRRFRGTCARCSCQVECEIAEVLTPIRDAGGNESGQVKCPTQGCASMIIVKVYVTR